MQITAKLAQSIVNEISRLIGKNINFMNDKGLIIASNDKQRIGTFHEGALAVLNTKERVIIKEGENLQGAKPGINLPVFLNERIIGVIGITGKEEEVKPFGEVIRKMTEILLKEAFFEQQTELYRRARNTFIDEWLNGKIEEKEIFSSRGWMHKINVHLPRIVIVLGPVIKNCQYYTEKKQKINVEDELNIQSLINRIYDTLEDFLKYEPQNILYMASDSSYVIIHTISLDKNNKYNIEMIEAKINQMINNVMRKYSIELAAGIGRFHPEIEGVHKSYIEAKRAFEVAKKQHKILFYEQLGIESFIEELSVDVKREFIERIFPFHEDKNEMEKIVNTLKVFFDSNQSLEVAARQLYIHKNTLQYRLKRIKDLTGYDPRKFMDAILLYIALSFYLSD